ncbi:hypothetical protein F5Y18DRAFT_397331 [Xylariaceae sp. FL1019]|nr:hypothetical protein F5Y18DRAFT_397331 [Xylariaceae sp. FL1019]
MFQLPEAKCVRREDLFDSEASDQEENDHDEQAESAARAKINAQLSGLFELSFTVPVAQEQNQNQEVSQEPEAADEDVPPDAGNGETQEVDEENTFTFRLFRDEDPSHTVVLTNDDVPSGPGSFIHPKRPTSYYLAAPLSPKSALQHRSVAVTPEYLIQDALSPRWGLEKPWRVLHIPASQSLTPTPRPESELEKTPRKKTRPGKKHRILQRTKQKAQREREEKAKLQAADKELHLQEKKKRLNRERKLKRRQKEREKKRSATGVADDAGDSESDGE